MKEVFTATQHHMSADRRAFLKVATAAGLGLAGVALSSTTSFAQDSPTIGTDPGAQMMNPSNAKEFAMAVISRAELSLAASKIAVDRATKADAKEFAGFELTEAIAVTTVLKDLGTPVPTMTAKAKATFKKITNASAGPEFDKAYIQAQYDNHVELRDLTEAYLGHPVPPKSNMAEKSGTASWDALSCCVQRARNDHEEDLRRASSSSVESRRCSGKLCEHRQRKNILNPLTSRTTKRSR